MEHYLHHVLGEYRRRRVRLADDDALGVDHLALLTTRSVELGLLYAPDVEVAERLGHPAPLFHVGQHLARGGLVGPGRPSTQGLTQGLERREFWVGSEQIGIRGLSLRGSVDHLRRGEGATACGRGSCPSRGRRGRRGHGAAYFRMARLSAVDRLCRSARDGCVPAAAFSQRQPECRRLEAPVPGTADLGDGSASAPAVRPPVPNRVLAAPAGGRRRVGLRKRATTHAVRCREIATRLSQPVGELAREVHLVGLGDRSSLQRAGRLLLGLASDSRVRVVVGGPSRRRQQAHDQGRRTA